MGTHFEMELEALRQKILGMADQAKTAVDQAVQSFVQRDPDLAERVHQDDEILDRYEVEIDEMTILILTKAPLASDLRLIPVTMKISQNLERIGDEATKIDKRARDLARESAIKINFDFDHMAGLTADLLRDAVNAFIREDSAAARAVIPRDKDIDLLNKEIRRHIIAQMTESPDTIGRCLHWIVAVKSLERIGDHAKNIAEEVVYLCEAQDIRHGLKN
jgi:phosphate transport system protein